MKPDANRFPHLTVESEVLAHGADWQESLEKKLFALIVSTDNSTTARSCERREGRSNLNGLNDLNC